MRILMRRAAATTYARRVRDVRKFGIGSGDLVLDLGSGQDPHPRANILCDKFLFDSSERSMGASLVTDRPLIVADAARTPFADKTFDFIFCSHLVEHVEEPRLVLEELQRIGRAGYIETPSLVYEKLWGWRFHRWFVTATDDQLIFEPKTSALFDPDLHDWFNAKMQEPSFWNFVMTRLHELGLTTRFVWRDQIAFDVRAAAQDLPNALHAEVDAGSVVAPGPELQRGRTLGQGAKMIVGRRLRSESDARVPEALAAMRCVVCRSSLRQLAQYWACSTCNATYPIRGDLHVFATEEGKARGAAAVPTV